MSYLPLTLAQEILDKISEMPSAEYREHRAEDSAAMFRVFNRYYPSVAHEKRRDALVELMAAAQIRICSINDKIVDEKHRAAAAEAARVKEPMNFGAVIEGIHLPSGKLVQAVRVDGSTDTPWVYTISHPAGAIGQVRRFDAFGHFSQVRIIREGI